MYLFNGICLTDNLVNHLHRQVKQKGHTERSRKQSTKRQKETSEYQPSMPARIFGVF